MKKVSVVIPCYNPGRDITETINSVSSQNPFEIIVVDDGSNTDVSFLEHTRGIRFLRNKHGGAGAARNKGIAESRGDIIAFIDSDCIPGESWLNELTKPLKEMEGVGGVGGTYRTKNKDSIIAWLIGEEISYRHRKYKREIEFIGTYSAAFPKSVLTEVGGFCEDFTYADSEDNDLSYKITSKGLKLLFEPKSYVYHRHPEGLKKYMKNQMGRAYWRVLLYKKHKGRLKGDKYSGVRDFVQAPLALFSLLMAGLSAVWGSLLIAALASAAVIALLQVKESASIISNSRSLRGLFIIPLNFLRSYAWMAGLCRGIFRFVLGNR